MLVAHVVDRNVPTVHPEDDILSAARRLLECRSGVLPVGSRRSGALVSSACCAAGTPSSPPTAAPMVPTPCRSRPRCRRRLHLPHVDSLGLAGRGLRRSGIEAVPVLDANGYLVGVLSFADLMRAAPR